MTSSIGLIGQGGNEFAIGGPVGNSPATLALDSAYTYNSAGDAVAARMAFADGGTVDGVWVFISSYTGTWANTDEAINIELREIDAVSNKPGTLVTNGTTTLDLTGAPTGWKKATFSTPPTVVAQKPYAIVFADADGGASDFVTVGRSVSSASGIIPFGLTTTSNGFSTPSNVNGTPLIGVDVNGIMHGWPFTERNTRASSSLMYGIRIKPDADIECIGAYIGVDEQLQNGQFKLFLATQAPGDSPQKTFAAFDADYTLHNKLAGLFDIDDRVTLSKDTAYYFVLDKSSSATVPREIVIGTGADASLRKLTPYAGEVYEVAEVSGTPNFFTEDTNNLPLLGMIARPIAGAGGGGGMIVHPGMSGGMHG